MSDGGLGDDLFPDSPDPSDAPLGEPTVQPVASGSQSRTPTPSPTAESPKPGPSHQSPTPGAAAENDDEDRDEDDDDMGGLFGDDDEDEPKPADGDEGNERKRDSSATPEANPLEYEEEEGEGVEVEQYYTNLMLPKLPRMSATDGKVWHMKLPAYVNIDNKPYDADYYHATAEDDDIDGKEQPMLAKQKILAVKNTIRWRWTAGLDGQQKQESNARMVRWSDGSMSLQLGSDLFDVASSHGTSLARPEDLEKAGNLVPPAEQAASTSTTFLCTPSTYERVLMTETAIAGQLSLVPTSRTSKTHIELVKHVGQQHVKHSRMIIMDERTDPNLSELLLKAAGKDPNKSQKPKAKRAQGSGGVGRKSSRRSTNIYSDDENDLPPRKSAPGDYEDDDGFIVADDDEEDEAEETEDEDEMAWGSNRKHKSKSKSSKTRKRKDSDDEDDDEMDEMEEAERRIEQRERERKRAKKEKKKKSRDYVDTDEDEDEDVDQDPAGDEDAEGEQDMDMDMESEED